MAILHTTVSTLTRAQPQTMLDSNMIQYARQIWNLTDSIKRETHYDVVEGLVGAAKTADDLVSRPMSGAI